MIVYRFARQERREDTKGYKSQVRKMEDDLLHTHIKVPAIFQIDKPIAKKQSEGIPYSCVLGGTDFISETVNRPGVGPHAGSIYNYLAESNIRFRLANKDLPK